MPPSNSLPMDEWMVVCAGSKATHSFGISLGKLLFPGAIVALVGPLGAGKTFLTRAIAEGLGFADSQLVTSPTFVLIQEYAAAIPIYHFDVYRLKHGSDFVDLGALEYLSGDGVCLIEWADKVEALLPRELLWVELLVIGDESREVRIRVMGERYVRLIKELREVMG